MGTVSYKNEIKKSYDTSYIKQFSRKRGFTLWRVANKSLLDLSASVQVDFTVSAQFLATFSSSGFNEIFSLCTFSRTSLAMMYVAILGTVLEATPKLNADKTVERRLFIMFFDSIVFDRRCRNF